MEARHMTTNSTECKIWIIPSLGSSSTDENVGGAGVFASSHRKQHINHLWVITFCTHVMSVFLKHLKPPCRRGQCQKSVDNLDKLPHGWKITQHLAQVVLCWMSGCQLEPRCWNQVTRLTLHKPKSYTPFNVAAYVAKTSHLSLCLLMPVTSAPHPSIHLSCRLRVFWLKCDLDGAKSWLPLCQAADQRATTRRGGSKGPLS